VLEVLDAARDAKPIAHAQPIPLSFGQRRRICSRDQCSAGSNTAMQEEDGYVLQSVRGRLRRFIYTPVFTVS